MPHSSGGGSSGGGFHSGGSSGSSNHISTHYYPGARRYRRFYSDGRPDEYVYASSKPGKTSLTVVIVVALFGLICIGLGGFGVFSTRPRFIVPKYSDDPAIHDVAGVLDNKEELLELMKKYNMTTGICPVIYTTFDEEWNRDYEKLQKFTYDKYVSNFKDEQHFVIVYSIPAKSAVFNPGGLVTSKEFKWEACQGDETDNLITEKVFRKFGTTIQKDLEAGKGPGRSFVSGFKYALSDAEKKLNPTFSKRIINVLFGSLPLVITAGFFVLVFVLVFRSYRKDKAMNYEEAPLDVEPVDIPGLRAFTNANGGVVTEFRGPGQYERSVNYDFANQTASKIVKVISLAVIVPFVLIGIGVTAGGAVMLNSINGDKSGAVFVIIFGVLWTFISVAALISILGTFSAMKKKTADHLTVKYPDMNPVTQVSARPTEQTEFDPQFFDSAKSDYDSDDDDYKRMKRRGYE